MKTVSQVLDEKSNDYSHIEDSYFKVTGSSMSFDLNSPLPNINNTTKPLSVSVVIPAWNASKTILSCLAAIEQSSFNKKYQSRLQVIVVDDGSTDKTWETVNNNPLSLNLIAAKQNNCGQAKALNTGISIADGDIIISCDADMILNCYAIEHFMARHQIIPNVLLTGFRADVLDSDPIIKPDFIRNHGSPIETSFEGDERIIYSTPGWPSNMCLASGHYKQLGYARGLWMPDDTNYTDPWRLSDLVFGALFSLSREAYLKVGGYDERLYGWGSTDGLLAAKAISADQYVIPVYSASGLHIKHPFRTKDKQLEYSQNRKKFFEIIRSEKINYRPNWITHAKNRIIESVSLNHSHGVSERNVKRPIKGNNRAIHDVKNQLALGNYPQALKTLNNNKLEFNNETYYTNYGKISIGLCRYQDAIDALANITSSTKSFPEAMTNIAIAQAANDQFDMAKKTLDKLAQVHPSYLPLRYWLHSSDQNHIRQGEKYFKQEFFQIALRCFEVALIAEPLNKIALKYRDKCLAKMIS